MTACLPLLFSHSAPCRCQHLPAPLLFSRGVSRDDHKRFLHSDPTNTPGPLVFQECLTPDITGLSRRRGCFSKKSGGEVSTQPSPLHPEHSQLVARASPGTGGVCQWENTWAELAWTEHSGASAFLLRRCRSEKRAAGPSARQGVRSSHSSPAEQLHLLHGKAF